MSLFSGKKSSPVPEHPRQQPKYPEKISSRTIENIFSGCADFESRELSCGGENGVKVFLCFLDGVVNSTVVSEDVIRPLTNPLRFGDVTKAAQCVGLIMDGGIYCRAVRHRRTTDEVVTDIVQGSCALIFDSLESAVTFEVRSALGRSVEAPTLEKSVKGSKESFVETLRSNTALVRRKLRLPELKFIQTTVGRKSGTVVAVAYIDGVASPSTLEQILAKLDSIDIDGALSSGNIEEYISPNPSSLFPQIHFTERPDRFAMNLLEGRVGLLVDGLPIGFMLPATFIHFLKVPEDNAQHFIVASGLRLLRYLALILAVILPAVFVAVAMYHQEMIPTKLLLSMIENKQQVPFPVAVEVIGMLISFELLQEAGLRLPAPVGETVSIIGALIVGQSAVEARVISPIVVIVVAFAGIAGYTMPNQDLSAAVRVSRFGLTVAAIAAGMFGVAAGITLLIWHLCSLEGFGVAYMSPMSQGRNSSWKTALRIPLRHNKLRDPELNPPDRRRQK